MEEALKLMMTGMGTVFIILIMVVVLGNVIIRITNKFASPPLALTENRIQQTSTIEPSKLAAIISAVEITSKGKGTITSIRKIEK